MEDPRSREAVERAVQKASAPLDLRFDLWEVRAVPEGDGTVLEGRSTSRKAIERLREALRASGNSVEDRVRLLPPEGAGERIVSAPVADLRARPDHRSSLLTQAILGERLLLLDDDEEDGWAPVRAADGYVGYAPAFSLAEVRPDRRTDRDPSPLIRIAARRALVHAVPSETSLPIREAVFGSVLLSRSGRGEWTGVELPDGPVGWVKSALTAPAAGRERATPGRIVETARIFLGVPYLWGGASSFGFDCSGFAQRVFGAWGIRLPRDADLQHRAAAPLREGARRREGDLLFFGEDRITHVAVSLGGTQFIHASGWVRVQSLHPDSPSYRKDLRALYRGAGRVPGLDHRT